MPDPWATARPTADCAAATVDVTKTKDVMKAKDVVRRSGAWLLFPKGQEHSRVSQTPAPGGRSLLAVRNPTPSALGVLMKFAEQQNKL